jgi:N-acetylmuramidase, autolytic enzyme, family 25 glycosyl hydrolase
MMKGIDVAKWNGIIDWAKVKKAGVEFAVLKVIDKSNKTESSFVRNYAGASAQRLPLDVYNYLYTTTEAAAREAAKAVVNALAGRKIGKVWADAEDACLKNKGIQLIRILNSYKAVIEAAGYEFGVYTGLSFYNSYIKPYKAYIDCDFWIARYPSTRNMTIAMDPPASKKPAICHNLWGWQHSSRGRVPGISGYVDMDICYTKVTSSGIVQSTTAYYPRYTGTSGSIVAALNAVGVNSSFANRKAIAKENGITGYIGSAKQNIQMLALLKSGKLKRT